MSKFSDTADNMNKIVESYRQMREEVQKSLQEQMKEIFIGFFELYPEIKTIHWIQYTPYFNDGDECTFRMGDVYFSKTEFGDIEDTYGESDEDCIAYNKIDGNMETLSKLLRSDENENVMIEMFDNHVWVCAHRNGFMIEEYSHD